MQKVYKMPILYSFYNHGDIRMAVTEQEMLAYKTMTDRQHLSKAKTMPIHFLKASGKGFFIDKEGFAIALREDLQPCLHNKSLAQHMKDILEYRTMEYYRRRYTEK